MSMEYWLERRTTLERPKEEEDLPRREGRSKLGGREVDQRPIQGPNLPPGSEVSLWWYPGSSLLLLICDPEGNAVHFAKDLNPAYASDALRHPFLYTEPTTIPTDLVQKGVEDEA